MARGTETPNPNPTTRASWGSRLGTEDASHRRLPGAQKMGWYMGCPPKLHAHQRGKRALWPGSPCLGSGEHCTGTGEVFRKRCNAAVLAGSWLGAGDPGNCRLAHPDMYDMLWLVQHREQHICVARSGACLCGKIFEVLRDWCACSCWGGMSLWWQRLQGMVVVFCACWARPSRTDAFAAIAGVQLIL